MKLFANPLRTLALCFAILFASSFNAFADPADEAPLIEIRVYKIKPGKMADWLKFFHEDIAPPMEASGIKIHAAYTSLEDPDTFVWIREFTSRAKRDAEKKAFYQGDVWQKQLKPRLRDYFEKVEKVYELTPSSE